VKNALVAIASAILVTCAPAFAQGGAAPLPSADPAVVQATKQMLATMRVRETMASAFQQVEQQMPAQMAQSVAAAVRNNPKMDDKQKADAIAKFQQDAPKMQARLHAVFADKTLIDDMVNEMVPAYAETYTLDEIRQLTAFYASPLGQKMLAKMPQLMARSMEIGNRVMAPRMEKFMAESMQDVGGQ
jgi:hypothetical protein